MYWRTAMATVQAMNRLVLQMEKTIARPRPHASELLISVVRTLAFEARRLLGAALLFVGTCMMSTLLLLPVGLPLALVAVALIAAPRDP
jgi:hypothetical protein